MNARGEEGAGAGAPRWARPAFGIGVFVAALAFLGPGVQRAVGPGDSAELVVASATLGIPHPTGYPLYTWFGKLFTLLPFGSVATRVNFMSAAWGALALAVLADVLLRELRWRGAGRLAWPAALAAPALLLTTGPFQKAALVAEVYTFKCLFAMLLLHVASGYARRETTARLYVLALLFGLALGVHMSVVFLLPFLLLLTWRRLFGGIGVLLRSAGFVALGLSQYVLLYLRALSGPTYVHPQAHFFERSPWTGTDASLVNWAWFVTGGRWRGGEAWSLGDLVEKGARLGDLFADQYGIAVLAIALAGLALSLVRRDGRRRAAVFAAFLLAGLAYYAAFRPVTSIMVLPLLASVCAFAALGLGMVPLAVGAWTGGGRARRMLPGVALSVLGILVLHRVVARPRLDYSDRDSSQRFVERMIAKLPEGSAVAGLEWYHDRIALYCELVEGRELPFRSKFGARFMHERIAADRAFVLGSDAAEYRSSGYALEPFLEVPGEDTLYRIRPR